MSNGRPVGLLLDAASYREYNLFIEDRNSRFPDDIRQIIKETGDDTTGRTTSDYFCLHQRGVDYPGRRYKYENL